MLRAGAASTLRQAQGEALQQAQGEPHAEPVEAWMLRMRAA